MLSCWFLGETFCLVGCRGAQVVRSVESLHLPSALPSFVSGPVLHCPLLTTRKMVIQDAEDGRLGSEEKAPDPEAKEQVVHVPGGLPLWALNNSHSVRGKLEMIRGWVTPCMWHEVPNKGSTM